MEFKVIKRNGNAVIPEGMFKLCGMEDAKLISMVQLNTLKEEYWSPENQLWRKAALGVTRPRAGAPFFAPALATANRRAGTGMILLAF